MIVDKARKYNLYEISEENMSYMEFITHFTVKFLITKILCSKDEWFTSELNLSLNSFSNSHSLQEQGIRLPTPYYQGEGAS